MDFNVNKVIYYAKHIIYYSFFSMGLLLASCNSTDEPETAQERAQRINDLILLDNNMNEARKLFNETPSSMKPELANEFNKQLLIEEDESYWFYVSDRLRLTKQSTFVEIIRNGSDEVLLRCLRWTPPETISWPDAIDSLSLRWEQGGLNQEWNKFAWQSLAFEDHRGWLQNQRKILLDLLVKFLKEQNTPDCEDWMYDVLSKAFDIEAVSGKELHEMFLSQEPLGQNRNFKLSEWLEANQEKLLNLKPPIPKPSPTSDEPLLGPGMLPPSSDKLFPLTGVKQPKN